MPALTHSACQVFESCRKSFLINDLTNSADRTEASAACQIPSRSTSILYRSHRRWRNINNINALPLELWHKFRIQAQTISMARRSGTRKRQTATRAKVARSRPIFRRAGPGAGRAPRCIPGLVVIFWARLRSLAVKGDVDCASAYRSGSILIFWEHHESCHSSWLRPIAQHRRRSNAFAKT